MVEAGLLSDAVRFVALATARYEEEGWIRRWRAWLAVSGGTDMLVRQFLLDDIEASRGGAWAAWWLDAREHEFWPSLGPVGPAPVAGGLVSDEVAERLESLFLDF